MADSSSVRGSAAAPSNPAPRQPHDAVGPAGSSLPTLLDVAHARAADPTRPAEGVASSAIPLPLDPPRLPGSLGRIGHYEVLNIVGRGGMGVVLRAFDEQLHRNVAIKVMSAQLISSDAARQRFVREARSAAGISHPNVVTIHAVAEQAGIPFLVMEYVDGRTLQDRIAADAPLEVVDILRISSQICDGLAAAHRHGIVHRDIKPANVILEDGIERAKITDFGLARLVMEHSDLTSLQNLVGTPAYMSPEQVVGDDLDHRSDLFSLGCVMYAMVVGRSPFHGNSAIAIARKVKDEPHRPLEELAPGVPDFLVSIIDRLLRKNPAERFQSADELGRMLAGYLAELNIRKTEPSTLIAPSGVDAGRGRRRAALALAGILGLVGASWLIWHFTHDGARAEPETGAVTAGADPRTGGPGSTGERAPRTWTVAAGGPADFKSLSRAINSARAGDVIEVLDDGEYAGPFVIADAKRYDGLQLVARAGATLASSGEGAVLTIAGTPRVRIDGFRIKPGPTTHSLYLHYDATGCRLENLTLEQPADSTWANVLLAHECRATPGEPLVIRNCRFRSSKFGIYVGPGETDGQAQAAHVLVEGNQFTGPATHVVFGAAAEGIRLERNVFRGGVGVHFDGLQGGPPGPIELRNNTFFRVEAPFSSTGPNDAYDVTARNNLFLEVGEPPPTVLGGTSWHAEANGWEHDPPATPGPAAKALAVVADADVPVRAPDAKGFLAPRPGGWAASAGLGGDLPPYLGAVAPSPPTSQ